MHLVARNRDHEEKYGRRLPRDLQRSVKYICQRVSIRSALYRSIGRRRMKSVYTRVEVTKISLVAKNMTRAYINDQSSVPRPEVFKDSLALVIKIRSMIMRISRARTKYVKDRKQRVAKS